MLHNSFQTLFDIVVINYLCLWIICLYVIVLHAITAIYSKCSSARINYNIIEYQLSTDRNYWLCLVNTILLRVIYTTTDWKGNINFFVIDGSYHIFVCIISHIGHANIVHINSIENGRHQFSNNTCYIPIYICRTVWKIIV